MLDLSNQCDGEHLRLSSPGMWIMAAVLLAAIFTRESAWGSQKYDVTGVLLQVDREHQTISVSCQEIPGYMDAMVMPFTVRDPKMLSGLEPGMSIDFSLVVDKDSSHAESIRARPFESLELDPTQARRYKLMENAIASRSSADILHVG